MSIYEDIEGAALLRTQLKELKRKGYRDGLIIVGVSYLLFSVIVVGGLTVGEDLFLGPKAIWAWLVFWSTCLYGCIEVLLAGLAINDTDALEVYEDYISLPRVNCLRTRSWTETVPLDEISEINMELRENKVVRFEISGEAFRRKRVDPVLITDADAFEESLQGKVEVVRVDLPS